MRSTLNRPAMNSAFVRTLAALIVVLMSTTPAHAHSFTLVISREALALTSAIVLVVLVFAGIILFSRK
jgi:hypothetical protein